MAFVAGPLVGWALDRVRNDLLRKKARFAMLDRFQPAMFQLAFDPEPPLVLPDYWDWLLL